MCTKDLFLSHCFHIAQRKLGCWPRDVSELPSRQPISAIACHLRRLFNHESFRQKGCSVGKSLHADKSRFLTMTANATQTTMVFKSIRPAIESAALVSLRQTFCRYNSEGGSQLLRCRGFIDRQTIRRLANATSASSSKFVVDRCVYVRSYMGWTT